MPLFSHGKHGSQVCAPNDDNVTQHGGLTRVNTKSCSLGLQHVHVSLILKIHAMVNWHLSKQGICWPVSCDCIVDLGLEFISSSCVFVKLTADQTLVFDWMAGSCLTCSDQGQVVPKAVDANTELRVDWSMNFLLYKCFSLLLSHWFSWTPGAVQHYSKSKQKANPYTVNDLINARGVY